MSSTLNKTPCLDKHKHYLPLYKSKDTFWGIGIENETYLQFSKPKCVTRDFMLRNHKDERYSVDYFANYKPAVFVPALSKHLTKPKYDLPVLMNSHSFQSTDAKNQPKTLYKKDTPPNPKFAGRTLIELLQEKDPFFKNGYMTQFIFDGDTIEFATNRFYKATIEDVIQELTDMKASFIEKVRTIFAEESIFPEYGEIDFAKKNHGLATFMTNLNNVAIFNNMTYHFNITLPTKLDDNAQVQDPETFVRSHQNAIRVVQWIVPLLIAKYGAPDVLATASDQLGHPLTHASQRVALSRYIGAGSYDTNRMPRGKLLNAPFHETSYYNLPYWWYHPYYKKCGYIRCDSIGFDFNFNKHKNHGIEFRVIDYFPEEQLHEFMCLLVYLMDHSLCADASNPVEDPQWNDMMYEVILKGDAAELTSFMIEPLKQLFNLPYKTLSTKSPLALLKTIQDKLCTMYHGEGVCSKLMIRTEPQKTEVTCKTSGCNIA